MDWIDRSSSGRTCDSEAIPKSFNLEATPATLTIAARNSKHRKLDVRPLHPELVTMVRDWLREIPPDAFLFPKLAKRRTWLMVQKDLEKAGIPYITSEGVAEFHAAGRPVIERQDNDEVCVDAKACCLSFCGTEKQKKSSGDSPDDSWRRGELNEQTPVHNSLTSQQLTKSDPSLSVHCQWSGVSESHKLTSADAVLSQIIQTWPTLSAHTHSLVEAICLQPPSCDPPSQITASGNSELAEIVGAWSEIPVELKHGVMSLVRWSVRSPQTSRSDRR